MSLQEIVTQIVEKNLSGLYDIVSIKQLKMGDKIRLQIMIDKLDHSVIEHKDCSRATRLIRDELHDSVSEDYLLEVSSPGLNRPLNKPMHFQKYIGYNIRFKWNGTKHEGVIKSADNEGFELESLGNISYQDIKDAKLYNNKGSN
ncbi:MAG: hypothetical protein H6850_02925 [Alphaproteobacteria bacterium]|nr:MAG: hypothetical protein H6850_02925 [Alphaproteobacteria bacterium]